MKSVTIRPAERAAQRNHQVEAGEIARRGLHRGELAVEEHAHHEETGAEERQRLLDVRYAPLVVERPRHGAHDYE
jgi:hypothetical protein